VHLTSNLGAGGAERQVANVMQSLRDQPLPGEETSLVVNSLDPVLGNDFFLPQVTALGQDIIDLETRRRDAHIREICAQYPDLAGTVQQLAALPGEISRVAIPFFAHLVETRPRIVHLWQDAINIGGGVAAMAAGVPHIVLCTRSTRPVEIRRHRRYLREGYLALFKYSGRISVLNNSANGARDYADWLDIPPETIQIFRNGYDFDAIRGRAAETDRDTIRARLKVPPSARLIGGVMRFSAEKRPELWVDTVVEGVQAHEDVHGLIVGDGPMRADLMARVTDLGLSERIQFPGRQSPVEPWMRAMDILFLSSVTEGLPNVLIEAQALGLPVATMDVGGAPETLDPGQTGLVLSEAAPGALAQKICALLHDTERLSRMGQNGRRFVEASFSLAVMRDALARCYATGAEDRGC
jgi:glycosyltransferase involved in cell wall biosynthesis